jgi:hypothetical protein
MSVIFGVRKLAGEVVTEQELLCLATISERYAPEGTSVHHIGWARGGLVAPGGASSPIGFSPASDCSGGSDFECASQNRKRACCSPIFLALLRSNSA